LLSGKRAWRKKTARLIAARKQKERERVREKIYSSKICPSVTYSNQAPPPNYTFSYELING
jgi:hypothetical protein